MARARKQDWSPGDSRMKQFRARLRDTVQDAETEFWVRIARSWPEARTGDLPAESGHQLLKDLEWMVLHWLVWNAPPPIDGMANDELERRA